LAQQRLLQTREENRNYFGKKKYTFNIDQSSMNSRFLKNDHYGSTTWCNKIKAPELEDEIPLSMPSSSSLD